MSDFLIASQHILFWLFTTKTLRNTEHKFTVPKSSLRQKENFDRFWSAITVKKMCL